MIKVVLTKYWFLIVLTFILAFMTAGIAFGQEQTDQIAKKYGVAFPIAELGNCSDYASCRSYCEDPVHKDACVAFAKAKGFYKEDAATVKANTLIEAAKVELGCSSFESCKSYCEDDNNRQKCDVFAKTHKLNGGQVDSPAKKEIIKKAEEVLGCNSEESCKNTCSDPKNQQKCSEFARSVGLRGGEVRKGPGGCSSEETCQTFCSDPQNFDQCSKYGSSQRGPEANFRGPGGCNSRESCENYCRSNPGSCSQINKPQVAPVDAKQFVDFCRDNPGKCFYNRFCDENPDKCQKDFSTEGVGAPRPDMGNCKTPGECYDYCKANPGKCQGFNPEAPRPDDKQYRQYTETRYDPEAACKRGGCSWSNNSCQCSQSGYNYQQAYPTEYRQSTMSRDQQEATCRQGGGTCSWNGDTCYCQGYRAPSTTNYTPYSGSGSYSSGSYTNNNYSSTNTSGMGDRASQEAACRAIGGTCTSSSPTFCGCSGPGGGGSSTGTTTTTTTTTNTNSTGMSRDQQEAGCRSCGGTCSWNGDMCQCQCGSTQTSTTTTQTQPTTSETQTNTQTEPTTTQTQTTTTQTEPAPAVQGISTVKNSLQTLWENLLKFFSW